MAVGNPFGPSQTVSTGIISQRNAGILHLRDAADSTTFCRPTAQSIRGTPEVLYNVRGEVIGINTAINAAGSGIGFAIPIDMVKEMLNNLKEKGRFVRSWIGIKPAVDEALADLWV